MALHSISSLSEPLHSCPTHPRLYIASLVLQVHVVQTWEFFLALGLREYACSGLYSLLALALERPNHYLCHFVYSHLCV